MMSRWVRMSLEVKKMGKNEESDDEWLGENESAGEEFGKA